MCREVVWVCRGGRTLYQSVLWLCDCLNGDVRDAVYTLLKEAVAACATHRNGAVSVRHVIQKMKQRISSRRRGGSREEQRRRKKRGKTNCVIGPRESFI